MQKNFDKEILKNWTEKTTLNEIAKILNENHKELYIDFERDFFEKRILPRLICSDSIKKENLDVLLKNLYNNKLRYAISNICTDKIVHFLNLTFKAN